MEKNEFKVIFEAQEKKSEKLAEVEQKIRELDVAISQTENLMNRAFVAEDGKAYATATAKFRELSDEREMYKGRLEFLKDKMVSSETIRQYRTIVSDAMSAECRNITEELEKMNVRVKELQSHYYQMKEQTISAYYIIEHVLRPSDETLMLHPDEILVERAFNVITKTINGLVAYWKINHGQ